MISHIENEWTGTFRETHHTAPESKMLCAIVHASSISSKTWELSRTLFCLAVDEDVLSRIRQYSELKNSKFLLKGMEKIATDLDQETVASILSHLKNRNTRDTLASAISHTMDFWRPISRLSSKKRELAGSEYEHSVILEHLLYGSAIRGLVQEIYRRHKPGGLLEPDYPCVRFSAQFERLERKSAADHRYSLPLEFPNRVPRLPEDGSLLLCSKYRNEKYMCIIVTKDICDPTSLIDVMSALLETISEGRFFILDGSPMPDNDGVQNVLGKQVEGALVPLIKTSAQLWGRDLLQKFNTKHCKDDYPEIYTYDESIETALRRNVFKGQPFSGVPEPAPRPNKRLRVFDPFRPTPHDLARSVAMPTYKSDNAEVEAILKKWGPTRFKKAFRSVLEDFERKVVTID